MKKLIVLAAAWALMLGAAGSLCAADVSVTGKWTAAFEAGGGQMKYTYDLKQDGTTVTGKAHRDRDGDVADVDLQEGALHGDQISFVEMAHFGDQDIRIEYKGTVTGDEMKLSRSVGDLGSADIVATREKTNSIAGKWTAEFDSQVGHQNYTYEFTNADGKLTGKATRVVEDNTNITDITEGKLSGDDVSFVEMLKVEGQDQPLQIEYTGKLAGDELKLSRAVGEFATNDIVAKRVKETTESK